MLPKLKGQRTKFFSCFISCQSPLVTTFCFFYFRSFNFSSDIKLTSVNDITKKILGQLDNKIQLIYDPIFIGKEADSIKLNNKKAKEELGWYPMYDYETIIKHTTNWYRKVISGDNPLLISEQLLDNYLMDYNQFEKNFYTNFKGNLNA